ncbi:hypothetical protein [Nonomuraea basaltis]|uniref:hypothetical protein n=1 Tax=Nonomuraea basaltis TaxID=2495887 RepID=UPI00110C4545|nr:hypothetical protein [Nonomuraea basaltis]TMR95535.1 hypothetical protein EJK15_28315 [Nonomuraea basaltis]
MRDLEIRPAGSWDDIQPVFGPHGAYSGRWCIWFRVAEAEFRNLGAGDRRARLQTIVEGSERAPGVPACLEGARWWGGVLWRRVRST